jgi:hypothetical protein
LQGVGVVVAMEAPQVVLVVVLVVT